MNSLRLAALLGTLLMATSVTLAQEETKEKVADPRIKATLDTLKYKYSVNKNKAYEVTFDLKDTKRSQVVFINSHTEKFSKMEIREVTSTAYKVKGKLSPEAAHLLLVDNDKRKWGGWRIVEEGEFTYVIYAVQLPADAVPDTLSDAIDAAMYTADEMEKEVTKEDNF